MMHYCAAQTYAFFRWSWLTDYAYVDSPEVVLC